MLPEWFGQFEGYRSIFCADRGPCFESRTRAGSRTGKSFRSRCRFRCESLTESRQWNLPIESSHALTAVPNLFLRQASRYSSTTNSSRTIPSIASNARQSVLGDRRGSALRRALPARSVPRKLQSPSSRRRAARCYAGPAFRSRGSCRRLCNLWQRRAELQVAPKRRGEACGADQRFKLLPMTLSVDARRQSGVLPPR
jgi:hypothetical protein